MCTRQSPSAEKSKTSVWYWATSLPQCRSEVDIVNCLEGWLVICGDGRGLIPGAGLGIGTTEGERMSDCGLWSHGIFSCTRLLSWATLGRRGWWVPWYLGLWWWSLIHIHCRWPSVLNSRTVTAVNYHRRSCIRVRWDHFHTRGSSGRLSLLFSIHTVLPYPKVRWEEGNGYHPPSVSTLKIPRNGNCRKWRVVQVWCLYELHQWRVWCTVEISTKDAWE